MHSLLESHKTSTVFVSPVNTAENRCQSVKIYTFCYNSHHNYNAESWVTKNKIIRDYLLDNLKQFSSAFSDVNVETVIVQHEVHYHN